MTSTPTEARTLDAHTLQERLADGEPPRILDVRTPAEFDTSHIPGAYNVPLDTLREHRDELRRHLDEDVVLVCRSGARATQAEGALRESGLPGVRVLDGGMTSWEAIGAPVNRGRQTWELERQVRLVAGTIVAGSVLASTAVPRLKWVAAAIGTGLTGAALTNTCAMGVALSKMPWNRTADSCDIDEIVAALSGDDAA
ncbi:rhodanese-like domain-containing protein [Nocardioides sp. zg-1228]|uniref:rhodanese-like domain-containing protein n=1 Tax=Nocardioides sp. zg-1228 TaxID=2763008 RepID=UPI0016431146|nr:rhodanese-like domain-containing protein [Nocardioides sp. zg-1228]MBC2934280.1 rhodanese-like domain-containing protein [Nocardioides sp. zg-1228]QSF59059.1 rhodanese-like domain-containing protein [Nocardioides sp. zg-1228]